MKQTLVWVFVILLSILSGTGCRQSFEDSKQSSESSDLTGAWRATLQFQSGPFASIKDLEFMYVFHADGTMTESSNYDAAPPVPPAYGVWRRISGNAFQAKYEFYITRTPTPEENASGMMGWMPAGRGRFIEQITLSADGNFFSSKIRYEPLDSFGKPIEGGGDASGRGARFNFE